MDDASPDPLLAAELRQLAEHGLVSLLVNGTNFGFVLIANRGLLLHENRDVVLLNSDTNVFGDWLDKIASGFAWNAPYCDGHAAVERRDHP